MRIDGSDAGGIGYNPVTWIGVDPPFRCLPSRPSSPGFGFHLSSDATRLPGRPIVLCDYDALLSVSSPDRLLEVVEELFATATA
jgi:hypothetical protein